ncbi:MAG: hypothetical protein WCP28_21035, partial [Actinomycetes bacterium]
APTDLPRIDVDVDGGVICGVPIEYGPVPSELAGETVANSYISANGDQVLFSAWGARVLVERGQRIVMDLEPGVTAEDVRFISYGWLPSLIMLERGCIFLHASTVSLGDATIAVAGGSGAGKSTTAAALCAAGWSLSCDDTTAVVVRDGLPWVLPYARPIHLLPDALHQVHAGAARTRLPLREKFAVDLNQDLAPRAITGIAFLQRSADPTQVPSVMVEGVDGLALFTLLERNLHLRRVAAIAGPRGELMKWFEVMATVAAIRIRRSVGADTVDEVCAQINASLGPSGPTGAGPVSNDSECGVES